jgi:hypothetical protein
VIERLDKILRRALARSFAVQAAKKLQGLFGGRLHDALADVSREAAHPPAKDEED